MIRLDKNKYNLGYLALAVQERGFARHIATNLSTLNPILKLVLASGIMKGTGGLMFGSMVGVQALSPIAITLASGFSIWAIYDLNNEAQKYLEVETQGVYNENS